MISISAGANASVVDLFCGAGGLSHGFKKEGFTIAAGVDIDETCRFSFQQNNAAPFLRKDVAAITPEYLDNLFAPEQVRILVGCAPCQPFSQYNQKNQNPDWQLLHSFGQLIKSTRPEVVSMENVPRLLAFHNGQVFEKFVNVLKAADYHVTWQVLYGPDFGLAQTRSRLVVFASLLGPVAMPKPTHNPKNYRTVRDEIGALPPLQQGQTDDVDPLHCASRISATNARRIASAKPGGTWRDWEPDLVASCHRVESGRGYTGVYGRMEWSAPSPTITTQFFGFGNGRFGHPEQDRALSLREGALLQGFPPDYQFTEPGERIQFRKVGRMIGNAVPVTLARAIARAVRQHVEASA